MEESWLEKLKRLLTEYDPFIKKDWEYTDNHWYFVYIWWSAIYGKEIWMLKIISKEYWFIKRLVENDKIDYDKIGEKIWIETHKAHFPVNKYWYVYDLELGDVSSADYSDYESLLMLLSISDTPIDDLILYLK